MKQLVLFASGSGTNAENITRYFEGHPSIRVVAVFCNNPQAGVIARMKPLKIPVVLFDKKTFENASEFLSLLNPYQPDLIVLAGFLWLLPPYLIHQFPDRMLNIHPALLPKFGGKGMYGHHVHEAVVAAGETEHGITIHKVNEQFDSGEPLFQARFPVSPGSTVQQLQQQIAELEMRHFPEVIQSYLNTL